MYLDQLRYKEAEVLMKNSLMISENALGANHPDVATALVGMAKLYRATGRPREAEPLEKRSEAIMAAPR